MQIYNYILSRARQVVENAFGILTQKFGLFYGRIQLRAENADKVVMTACILPSCLRNDVIVEDCVIENDRCSITVLLRQHFAVPVEVLMKSHE
jgi:hypothetical protein